ncbi:Mobile element protein [Marinobacterium lacunae]|uniref:Mobile element protein n=1 Tax=Marinobacterium lacunae TaxID=1232683 RepID=A0A081FWI1_9GAMM|nr:Mobile element protein [Marinobacterium lacunae]
MGHQLTFAVREFNQKRRQTRKEVFLGHMDQVIPWKQFESIITLIIQRQVMVADRIRSLREFRDWLANCFRKLISG